MPETRDSNEILDSWKEIAVFLRRGVRTVQRWEATEGLPVRRHDHLKRGSVYALRSDVALWVRTRQLGQKPPAHRFPMHCSCELRNQVAQQRHMIHELADQLQIQLASVMSSWKQLQRSVALANENTPLLEFVSHRKPQAFGAVAADMRRASA
jgi:hypothetical protein